jgi:putative peptidoglycan lipid II flippase
MFPYLFVISIAAFFQGILNGHHIFSPSGFTPILFNIIVIASSYLLIDYAGNPARAMAIGVILGGTVQALFQLPFVLKQGWKISLTGLKKTLSNPGTKRVLRLIAPTIIGMAAYQLNDFVSSIIAKNTGIGILSSIQYSLRLQELILGIFAVTVGTIILPDLSSLAKREKWQDYNQMLLSALKLIALITIPITFFSILFRENLIILIYKTNQFSDESVALTSGVFFFHIMRSTWAFSFARFSSQGQSMELPFFCDN